jgi:hypothetical protein
MLTRENVLEFWRSEEYKILSRHLIKKYSGTTEGYAYAVEKVESDTVNIGGRNFFIQEVIEFLDDLMMPLSSIKDSHFYRGDTFLDPGISCKKENYISVSTEIEDAITFINDAQGGTLSFVKIDPSVKCIKTGVEGEILLQHGCLWEAVSESTYEHKDFDGNFIKYRRIDVVIHSPSSSHSHTEYPYCSKMIPRESREELVKQAKISIDIYRERLRPFYNQYVEEAREFSESPKSEEFLESVRELNNIPSNTKRDLYSEFRTDVSKLHGVGKKRKHKRKKRFTSKKIKKIIKNLKKITKKMSRKRKNKNGKKPKPYKVPQRRSKKVKRNNP